MNDDDDDQPQAVATHGFTEEGLIEDAITDAIRDSLARAMRSEFAIDRDALFRRLGGRV